MDEVAPAGRSLVWEIRDGAVEAWEIDPRRHGLETDDMTTLRGGEPEANATRVRRLLERPAGDRAGRAAVVLNAAAAVYVAGLATDFGAATELAEEALDGGRAAEALERFLTAARPAARAG
jgi:anthranilate phosphoribosyltransferase